MHYRTVCRFSLCAALLVGASVAAVAHPGRAKRTISVTDFGAKGDGTMLETAAIQRAIDAAAKHGGIVVVPAGTYVTGAIFVKSGVSLQIEKGATLLGSEHLEDYPLLPTRVAGN